jgi:hypothetical protein
VVYIKNETSIEEQTLSRKFLTRRNCSYQISDKNKANLNKELG